MENNKSSRRDFLKKGSLVSIGLSTAIMTACDQQQDKTEKKESGFLNEKSKKIMTLFNLKYPIFQAAPGGEELAVAIANAGGMGAIGLGWLSPTEAYDIVVRMNEKTKGNYYGNYVLHFGTNSLNKSLEAGCKSIQFSWGLPNQEIVKKIKNAGAKLGIQVSSSLNAQKALELSPDFLICQGLEAGGHVQGTSYLKDVLPQIIEIAKEVPVLVAGGISDGHDIRNAIKSGAAGTVMGSRFIATKESDIHSHYKQRLVEAGENSTVYTNCFNKGWDAMHRVLRNNTFLNWEAAGGPLEGKKPGEKDLIANHPKQGNVERYSGMPPSIGYTGNLDDMVMYAGTGVSKIDDIPSASELIERLWQEFENK